MNPLHTAEKYVYDFHQLIQIIAMHRRMSSLPTQVQNRPIPKLKHSISNILFTTKYHSLKPHKTFHIRPKCTTKSHENAAKIKHMHTKPAEAIIENLITSIEGISDLNNVKPEYEMKRDIYYSFSHETNIITNSSSSISLFSLVTPKTDAKLKNGTFSNCTGPPQSWVKKYISRIEQKYYHMRKPCGDVDAVYI